MFSKSLAIRILLLTLLLLVLPMTAYFLIVLEKEYQQEISANIRRLQNISFARAVYLQEFSDNQSVMDDIIKVVSKLNDPHIDSDRSPQFVKLGDIAKPYLIGFFEYSSEKRYILKYASTPKYLGEDFTFRGYIQGAIPNGHAAYVYYDLYTFVPYFVTTKAIYSLSDNKLLGVLGIFYLADKLLQQVTNSEHFKRSETISLLTQDKIVVASSDPALNFVAFGPVSEEKREEIKRTQQFGNNKVPTKTVLLTPYADFNNVFKWKDKGDKHIACLAPVADGSFYILMDVNENDIGKSYARALWLVGVLLMVTLLSCLVTFVISRLLSQAMEELVSVMKKVGQGDLVVRFQKRPFGFEINDAGMTLNATLDRLVHKTKEAQSEQLKTEIASKELKIAREIQENILPHNIDDVKGLEIGVVSLPVGEVSGDFYDIYRPGGHDIITLVNTGKNLVSCLYSVCLRSMLRSFATINKDPSVILAKANALFHLDLQNNALLVQAFVGHWEAQTGTLRYSAASPSFGFMCDPSGKCQSLIGSHNTMGIIPDAHFELQNLTPPESSFVILYTNGLMELPNLKGDFYSEGRLCNLVSSHLSLNAKEMTQVILDDLRQFTDGSQQANDMIIVVLKIKRKNV